MPNMLLQPGFPFHEMQCKLNSKGKQNSWSQFVLPESLQSKCAWSSLRHGKPASNNRPACAFVPMLQTTSTIGPQTASSCCRIAAAWTTVELQPHRFMLLKYSVSVMSPLPSCLADPPTPFIETGATREELAGPTNTAVEATLWGSSRSSRKSEHSNLGRKRIEADSKAQEEMNEIV